MTICLYEINKRVVTSIIINIQQEYVLVNQILLATSVQPHLKGNQAKALTISTHYILSSFCGA